MIFTREQNFLSPSVYYPDTSKRVPQIVTATETEWRKRFVRDWIETKRAKNHDTLRDLRLVLTVQSEKRLSSLGTFGKSLRLVFSDFIQSNAVIFRTNCSTNVSVSDSENEKWFSENFWKTRDSLVGQNTWFARWPKVSKTQPFVLDRGSRSL